MASYGSDDVIRDELTCCICHDYYTKPKTLSCMHTFCEACLEKAITLAVPGPQGQGEEEGESDQVSCSPPLPTQFLCPTCRQPVILPEGGISSIKTNFSLANMVESIPRYCDKCTERDLAQNYCKECKAYLCHFCSVYHGRSLDYKSHTLVRQKTMVPPSPTSSLTSMSPAAIDGERRCPKHDERLCLYCSKCLVILCSMCVTLSHQECRSNIEYINNELVCKEKEMLREELDGLTSNEGVMGTHCDTLARLVADIDEKRDSILSMINATNGQFKERVESSTCELQSTVTTLYDEKSTPLKNQLQEVQKIQQKAKDIVKVELDSLDTMEKVIETKKETLKLSEDCKKALEIKIDPMIPHIEFLPSDSLVDPNLTIGHLKENIHSYLAIDPPSAIHQGEQQSLTLQARNKEAVNIKYGGAAIHPQIAHAHRPSDFLPYEVIDRKSGKYEIKYTPTHHTPLTVSLPPVYDLVLPVTRSYTPLVPIPSSYPLTSAPFGVCMLPENQMAVTLSEKKVVILDIETGAKRRELEGVFVRPYLMVVDHMNLWVTDREAHNIHRYSLSNYAKTLKYGTRGTQLGQFMHPRGIAIHPTTGRLYIADMKNHRIQVFKQDENNTIIPVDAFGKEGKGECEFDQPAGLMFNQDNQLVVCDDRNYRLQVLSDEGRYITSYGVTMGQKGVLCSPIGISQDPNGRYIVGEFGSHLVTVLDSEGKVLSCTRSLGGDVDSLLHPRGVAVDMDSYIYVADYGNKRVVRM